MATVDPEHMDALLQKEAAEWKDGTRRDVRQRAAYEGQPCFMVQGWRMHTGDDPAIDEPYAAGSAAVYADTVEEAIVKARKVFPDRFAETDVLTAELP